MTLIFKVIAQKLLSIKTIVKLIISGCGDEFSCCCIKKIQTDIYFNINNINQLLMLKYISNI